MKKMIQEEENKKELCSGTQANTTTLSTTSNVSTTRPTWAGAEWVFIDLKGVISKPKHPYIPDAIYCDPGTGVTIVKWDDGGETKVTCDEQDKFDWESGFSEALKIKVFGNNKAKFKDFWEAVLSRRVFIGGKKVTPLKYGRWEAQRKAELAKRKARKEKLNVKVKGKV